VTGRVAENLEALKLDERRLSDNKGFPVTWIYSESTSYLDNFFRNDKTNPRDFSVYPEYQSRTFRSLIIELRTLRVKNEQQLLDRLLESFDEMAKLSSIDAEGQTATKDDIARAIAKTRSFLGEIAGSKALDTQKGL
jgi:hypothetical protein